MFLDLNFEIENNILISCIYQNPSNKYLYFPPTSQHQSHIMMSVIKSELVRYRLYCVWEVDIYFVKTKFQERLRLRGYSNSYLDPIFQPTLDSQQFDTIKGMYSKSIRLYITVLLPKVKNPLFFGDFIRYHHQ